MGRLTRWTLWAAVCALLLQAGAPLLAAGAAQWRGLAVGEVCDVYGVTLPDDPHASHAGHAHHHGGHAHPGSHPNDAHSGDHCALTALGALATFYARTDLPAQGEPIAFETQPRACQGFLDACARWAARRKHEPPAKSA